MRKIKDPISGFTHLAGMIASIVGLVFLIIYSAKYSNDRVYDIVSFSLFGSFLILLYASSAFYHLLDLSEKATMVLKKIDHIMIYFVIAASYTPICLGPLRGGWGWSIFGVVFGLSIIGLFLTIFWISAPRWLTTGLYLAMGWMAIVAVYPMIIKFIALGAFHSLFWLLLGGIFYTIGGIIYGLKWPKLKNKHFSFHEIFHIFVLLGSLSHYWFVIGHLLWI